MAITDQRTCINHQELNLNHDQTVEGTMARDKLFSSKALRYRQAPGDNKWSEDKVQEVIKLWELNHDEEIQLRELQRKVADIRHYKNDPHILVRFMTAPWGYPGAEAAFRRMIEWRRVNNADNILDEYVPPQILLDSVPSALLNDYDYDGDPIYVERGGAVDVASLVKLFSREELMRCAIWQRERNTDGIWINDYEQRQQKKVKAITIIYDLKGLSSRHMNAKGLEIFRDIMKMTQMYFPGPIKRMLVIRAPKIFQLIWSVARHFFPPQARAKMIFTGSNNYLEALDCYMDRNVLPPCIYEGGSGDVAVGMMQSLDGIPRIDIGKVRGYATAHSTADTDEDSMASDDSFSTAFSGVNGKVILRGSWKQGSIGNVELQHVERRH